MTKRLLAALALLTLVPLALGTTVGSAASSAPGSPITDCGYWNGLRWSKTPPQGFPFT
jgi:hypothetical protein